MKLFGAFIDIFAFGGVAGWTICLLSLCVTSSTDGRIGAIFTGIASCIVIYCMDPRYSKLGYWQSIISGTIFFAGVCVCSQTDNEGIKLFPAVYFASCFIGLVLGYLIVPEDWRSAARKGIDTLWQQTHIKP